MWRVVSGCRVADACMKSGRAYGMAAKERTPSLTFCLARLDSRQTAVNVATCQRVSWCAAAWEDGTLVR
jgi:hypothetical protein